MSNVQSERHGAYVLTHDVASRIQSLRGFLVPDQSDPLFAHFHQRLYEIVALALPGIRVEAIDMSQLRAEIWRQVETRVVDLNSQVVLSTCQEISDAHPKSEGLLLNINRLFGTDGKMIGHGPRPGFECLNKQFDELVGKIAGRSVVLIEDGAFTGGTLRFVIQELKDRGVKVTAIVIGFCKNGSREAVKEVFDGELVIIHPISDLLDWIPDHDFIPFIPNCGRVLGEQTSEGLMPVSKDGVSLAYPYILPFGRTEEWASVPADHSLGLSRFCLDTSIKLFERVRTTTGRAITIGELLRGNPKVSMPIEIGFHDVLPGPEMELVSYLAQMRERIG